MKITGNTITYSIWQESNGGFRAELSLGFKDMIRIAQEMHTADPESAIKINWYCAGETMPVNLQSILDLGDVSYKHPTHFVFAEQTVFIEYIRKEDKDRAPKLEV
jgi:hypothetical protein